MTKYLVAGSTALIVLTGGFYFLSDYQSTDDASNQSNNQVVLTDSYVDWNSYKSEKYSLDFKYPKDFDLWEFKKENILIDPNPIPRQEGDGELPITLLSFRILDKAENRQQRADKISTVLQLKAYNESETTTASVSGLDATKIEGEVAGASYLTGNYFRAYYMDGQNYSLDISATSKSKEGLDAYRDTIEKIIISIGVGNDF